MASAHTDIKHSFERDGTAETTHSSVGEAMERYCLLIEQGFLPTLFEDSDGVLHVLVLPDTHP